MRAILSAELAALIDLSAAVVGADEATLAGCLKRARADADPERVEETILQSYLFLGFPAALEAMKRWRELTGPAGDADAGSEDLMGRLEDGPEETESWRERGEAVCRLVYGKNYEKLRANVDHIHPALDDWMVSEGYGKVLGRPGLDLTARELCIVAQLTAAQREVQLHSHLRGALNVGATIGEVEASIRIGLQHVEQAEWDLRVEQLWWRVRERWQRSQQRVDQDDESE